MIPIYVDVSVNDLPIKSIAIGRVEGDALPDSVNRYAVMEISFGEQPIAWDLRTQFEHRYGDGVNVCIAKALAALESDTSTFVVECASCAEASIVNFDQPQCPHCTEPWSES